MRIGVISDFHGNALAAEAVLGHLAGRSVDLVVNLGDILSGGLEPARTADLLMPLGLPTVRGNHERQVLGDGPHRPSDRLAREEMRFEHFAWFAALPPRLEVAPGVLAVHGTPNSDLDYLLDTVEPGGGARPATSEEVRSRIAGYEHNALILCGHTHLAGWHRVEDGPLIVNPGSVGWPAYEDDEPAQHAMEAGTPHARYAIVDDAAGSWAASFETVEYDWNAAAAIARRNGRLDLVTPLLEGRV